MSSDRPWEAIYITNRNKAFNLNQTSPVCVPVCFKCEKDGRKDTAHWARDRGVIVCPEWLAMNAYAERKKSRTAKICYWCLYLYKNSQDITFARCVSHTLYDTGCRGRKVPICEFYLAQRAVEQSEPLANVEFGPICTEAFHKWQDDEMVKKYQRMAAANDYSDDYY